MNVVLGIDFDNTLADYHTLFAEVAREWQLLTVVKDFSKKNVRDKVRLLKNGENLWQKLQVEVYGPKLAKARLSPQAADFIKIARIHHLKLYIVSHKTSYSRQYPLRQYAWEWLERNNFFENNNLGFSKSDVFFESTQREKIKRIIDLRCTHFIDDLLEVFKNETFPPKIRKLLYDPHHQYQKAKDIVKISSWQKINDYFFK